MQGSPASSNAVTTTASLACPTTDSNRRSRSIATDGSAVSRSTASISRASTSAARVRVATGENSARVGPELHRLVDALHLAEPERLQRGCVGQGIPEFCGQNDL